MPRAKKAGQPVRSIPGQSYGTGTETERNLSVVPLPDAQAQREQAVSGSAPSPETGGAAAGTAAPPPPPRADFSSAMDAARMMAPPAGELNGAPTGVVDPAAVRMDLWVRLAELTGDPSYLRIAQMARLA